MTTALVIPSNRESNLKKFLGSWDLKQWDYIVVVEDGPKKTFNIDVDCHYSWQEIQDSLKDNSWIISKKDSAVRNFGFYAAVRRLGADYVFTLDDDCMPVGDDFVKKHVKQLSEQSKWIESVPNIKTRGFPYQNLGLMNNVVLNAGLWINNLDYDAPQELNRLRNPECDSVPNGTMIVPNGKYMPVCGMNLCFKKEILPLMYFPLMGEDQMFSRFDDIWCGVILLKVCHHLNLLVAVGEPFVNHSRASNCFVNLIKEAAGIQRNETFWKVIDDIPMVGSTPSECMLEIADGLQKTMDEYYVKLGKAISIWVKLVGG